MTENSTERERDIDVVVRMALPSVKECRRYALRHDLMMIESPQITDALISHYKVTARIKDDLRGKWGLRRWND